MATPKPKKDIDWNPLTPPSNRNSTGSSQTGMYGSKGMTQDRLAAMNAERSIKGNSALEGKVQKTVNRQGAAVSRAASKAERQKERLRAASARYSAKMLKKEARKAGSSAKRDIKNSVREARIATRSGNSFGGRMGGAGGGINMEQLK
jgi:hypothetical protein